MAGLSTVKRVTITLLAAGSMGAAVATQPLWGLPERVEVLEKTSVEVDSVLLDIRLNTCLTLMEVRADSTTDRCRR